MIFAVMYLFLYLYSSSSETLSSAIHSVAFARVGEFQTYVGRKARESRTTLTEHIQNTIIVRFLPA